MDKSINEEILDRITKEMAKSIDFDIVSDILVKGGWVKLKLCNHTDIQKACEWISENVSNDCKNYYGTWVFKNAEDAIAFKLRWRCG